MAEEDLVELKFRHADGNDIGPTNCSPNTSVGSLKERIVAQWPKDKENALKTVNDVKLINAGKILENNKTLAESRLPIGEVPGGVITMHVVMLIEQMYIAQEVQVREKELDALLEEKLLWIKKPFSVPDEDTKCDKDKTENKKSKSMYCRRNSLLVSSWDL
ncbi:hypothetical protein RHSIM_Rhsim06G0086500 [Rhododendron simsii]|uniref:Ubiquitin-like domain-containing protein n=1 Tax=Rhododendron simsii TaxID=118357 RepID=A0A834LJ92_RHOSS|nr:hypothetical protein RHSIM_Rhsim06G0086500 [Rhododendron simsii]